jgi:uncharacterized protein (DUF433 family)
MPNSQRRSQTLIARHPPECGRHPWLDLSPDRTHGEQCRSLLSHFRAASPAKLALVLIVTGPKALSVNLGGELIVKDPDILGGTPVFRGTRVPFEALLDYLECGQTLEEFIDDFPAVTRETAISALQLAKSVLVGRIG